MKEDFEYYVITRSLDKSMPLLSETADTSSYLDIMKPVENPKILNFELGPPIPRKPVMADYHSSPDGIVSKKIYDVLASLEIEGIQLLPVSITGKDEEKYDDYWALHIYSTIKCVDMELSDCERSSFSFDRITKLILDKKILSEIPLEERLAFRLGESKSIKMVHKSVMDKIMSVNPTGVRFINIEDWNDSSFFE